MALQTLLLEIGTEELPAFPLHKATETLGQLTADILDSAKVPHGAIEVFSTPRRLGVLVADVPEVTEASVEEFRGPAAKIAFDEAGQPTAAALGFARGKGLGPEALERREENGTEYVWVVKETPAQSVVEILPGLLENLITSIPWPKSQRWGSRREQFSRPVRWLVAMLGSAVVPLSYAGLDATNNTYGHRFLTPQAIALASAEEILPALRAAKVLPSEAERGEAIREQVKAIEAATGLTAELPANTFQEVVNLTEWPTVMVGQFDELFLAVPKEIIVDAMLVHQRYFPLFNADGSLSNKFLITSNGNPQFEANIIDGNQRVVAARLYDAKFFYDEDLKQPLDAYVAKLDEVVFQEDLGTMGAKTKRLVNLVERLAAQAGATPEETADGKRAALLAKADLVTGAVVEFTSVQGIMGRYYALAAGENPQVAGAIADHYRPRFAGDEPAETLVGKLVATADKLDTICGLFALGQGPTGSSDPFALRRGAIGILAMEEAGLPVNICQAIADSLEIYQQGGLNFDKAAVQSAVEDFFIGRTKVMLRDEGIAADTIDAVLAAGISEPMVLVTHAKALEAARANDSETFEDLATAYARANNLRDPELGLSVDEGLFGEDEARLYGAIKEADSSLSAALEANDFAAALAVLAALRGPVDAFFENIMVMSDDQAIRENRLRLLNNFVQVFSAVADFGKMAKGKK